MARLSARLPENAPGDFYVDDSCIDCETCRVVAPEVFARSGRAGFSVVRRQPGAPRELLRAKMALVSCPTASIGTASKAAVDDAVDALPDCIADGVYYCGYASESSYGAASYFIRRDGGNVLVDSPRTSRPLINRLEALGGVATMFLSHRDDVADHDAYARRFACRRVMHSSDIEAGTCDVEVRISGTDPVELAPDLLAIPVPGHTRGSLALLYRREFLFTGDHLWGSDDGQGLEAGRQVCWYSWAEQTRSMERLLAHDFTWVLPGHGPRYHAPTPKAREALERLVREMKRRA